MNRDKWGGDGRVVRGRGEPTGRDGREKAEEPTNSEEGTEFVWFCWFVWFSQCFCWFQGFFVIGLMVGLGHGLFVFNR